MYKAFESLKALCYRGKGVRVRVGVNRIKMKYVVPLLCKANVSASGRCCDYVIMTMIPETVLKGQCIKKDWGLQTVECSNRSLARTHPSHWKITVASKDMVIFYNWDD